MALSPQGREDSIFDDTDRLLRILKSPDPSSACSHARFPPRPDPTHFWVSSTREANVKSYEELHGLVRNDSTCQDTGVKAYGQIEGGKREIDVLRPLDVSAKRLQKLSLRQRMKLTSRIAEVQNEFETHLKRLETHYNRRTEKAASTLESTIRKSTSKLLSDLNQITQHLEHASPRSRRNSRKFAEHVPPHRRSGVMKIPRPKSPLRTPRAKWTRDSHSGSSPIRMGDCQPFNASADDLQSGSQSPEGRSTACSNITPRAYQTPRRDPRRNQDVTHRDKSSSSTCSPHSYLNVTHSACTYSSPHSASHEAVMSPSTCVSQMSPYFRKHLLRVANGRKGTRRSSGRRAGGKFHEERKVFFSQQWKLEESETEASETIDRPRQRRHSNLDLLTLWTNKNHARRKNPLFKDSKNKRDTGGRHGGRERDLGKPHGRERDLVKPHGREGGMGNRHGRRGNTRTNHGREGDTRTNHGRVGDTRTNHGREGDTRTNHGREGDTRTSHAGFDRYYREGKRGASEAEDKLRGCNGERMRVVEARGAVGIDVKAGEKRSPPRQTSSPRTPRTPLTRPTLIHAPTSHPKTPKLPIKETSAKPFGDCDRIDRKDLPGGNAHHRPGEEIRKSGPPQGFVHSTITPDGQRDPRASLSDSLNSKKLHRRPNEEAKLLSEGTTITLRSPLKSLAKTTAPRARCLADGRTVTLEGEKNQPASLRDKKSHTLGDASRQPEPSRTATTMYIPPSALEVLEESKSITLQRDRDDLYAYPDDNHTTTSVQSQRVSFLTMAYLEAKSLKDNTREENGTEAVPKLLPVEQSLRTAFKRPNIRESSMLGLRDYNTVALQGHRIDSASQPPTPKDEKTIPMKGFYRNPRESSKMRSGRVLLMHRGTGMIAGSDAKCRKDDKTVSLQEYGAQPEPTPASLEDSEMIGVKDIVVKCRESSTSSRSENKTTRPNDGNTVTLQGVYSKTSPPKDAITITVRGTEVTPAESSTVTSRQFECRGQDTDKTSDGEAKSLKNGIMPTSPPSGPLEDCQTITIKGCDLPPEDDMIINATGLSQVLPWESSTVTSAQTRGSRTMVENESKSLIIGSTNLTLQDTMTLLPEDSITIAVKGSERSFPRENSTVASAQLQRAFCDSSAMTEGQAKSLIDGNTLTLHSHGPDTASQPQRPQEGQVITVQGCNLFPAESQTVTFLQTVGMKLDSGTMTEDITQSLRDFKTLTMQHDSVELLAKTAAYQPCIILEDCRTVTSKGCDENPNDNLTVMTSESYELKLQPGRTLTMQGDHSDRLLEDSITVMTSKGYELNLNDGNANSIEGELSDKLLCNGKLEEAITTTHKAVELQPSSSPTTTTVNHPTQHLAEGDTLTIVNRELDLAAGNTITLEGGDLQRVLEASNTVTLLPVDSVTTTVEIPQIDAGVDKTLTLRDVPIVPSESEILTIFQVRNRGREDGIILDVEVSPVQEGKTITIQDNSPRPKEGPTISVRNQVSESSLRDAKTFTFRPKANRVTASENPEEVVLLSQSSRTVRSASTSTETTDTEPEDRQVRFVNDPPASAARVLAIREDSGQSNDNSQSNPNPNPNPNESLNWFARGSERTGSANAGLPPGWLTNRSTIESHESSTHVRSGWHIKRETTGESWDPSRRLPSEWFTNSAGTGRSRASADSQLPPGWVTEKADDKNRTKTFWSVRGSAVPRAHSSGFRLGQRIGHSAKGRKGRRTMPASADLTGMPSLGFSSKKILHTSLGVLDDEDEDEHSDDEATFQMRAKDVPTIGDGTMVFAQDSDDPEASENGKRFSPKAGLGINLGSTTRSLSFSPSRSPPRSPSAGCSPSRGSSPSLNSRTYRTQSEVSNSLPRSVRVESCSSTTNLACPRAESPNENHGRISPSPSRRCSRINKGKIKWRKVKELGRGAFGVVLWGIDLNTGQSIAIKQIRLRSAKDIEKAKEVEREVRTLKKLSHPNIVELYSVERDGSKLNIIMEYVPSNSISWVINKIGKLSDPYMARVSAQILCALQYCHAQGLIHRDIKGKNVLIDNNGFVKLADFGSALLAHDETFKKEKAEYTPLWAAPELAKGECKYDSKIDIWSLGCTIVEMASAKDPWSECKFANPFMALYSIGNLDRIPQIPEEMSEHGRDFTRKCLTRDPEKRPSASELLEHKWVNQVLDNEEGGAVDDEEIDYEKIFSPK